MRCVKLPMLGFSDATYTHADFKQDVLSVLEGQYGSAVKAGDKAIAIDASGSRRKSDVIGGFGFSGGRRG